VAKSDVDSQESETTATEGFRRRIRLTQDRFLAAVLVASATAFLVIRLGSSLIGQRVFMGLGLFRLFEPWSSVDSRPVTTSIYVSDQLDGLIPALHEMQQRFWHGDLAEWSSYVSGGTSLLGTPIHGVISPSRWVYLVLPSSLAPGWSKLLELAFAAIFTYLLARRLDLSKVAAGLAGFSYPLTGFMIGWTNWPQTTVGSAIPMMFWAIERFVQDRRIRAAIPVAIAAALVLFGGFPAVSGQTYYAAGGYAVVRVISANWRRIRDVGRDLGLLGGAALVGIGLTAFQIMPFAKQVLGDVDLTYREGGFFTDTPVKFALTTVFPESFGGNQLWSGASPMDVNSYVGAVVLLLVAFGVLHALTGRIRGSAGAYYIAVIAAVVVLLWGQGPWTSWMDHLPIFHGNPIGRVRSQLGLPVAILAAAGFDWIRETRLSPGWWRKPVPEWRWLTALVAVAVCGFVSLFGLLISHGTFPGVSGHTRQDAVIACAPLVVIAGLLVLAVRWRAARTAALAVAIVSVVVQALAATSFYWPTAPRSEFYPTSSATKFLQQNQGHDRIATFGFTMRPNITEYYGLRTLNGHGFIARQLKSVIVGIDRGALLGPTYTAFSTAVDPVIRATGLDRFGVRYMIGGVDDVVPGTRSTQVSIVGQPDAVVPAAGATPLVAGNVYRTQIAASAVRGVNVPLTVATTTHLSVALKNPDGSVVAINQRTVKPGTANVTMPLAADPGGPAVIDPTKQLTVEMTVDGGGVTATTDAKGQIRVQAVRPPKTADTIRLAYAGDGMLIWERLQYVPRVHWATHATVIKDDAARLAAVTKSALDPGAVILAAQPVAALGGADAPAPKFDIVEDSGDTIRVRVQSARPGYVVVTDNIQTDFDATVDGKGTPIVAADYAGGAVYVGAGSHEIAVKYAPAGRRTGTMISAASGCVLCLVAIPAAWWARLRRRRRTPHKAVG
jgi:hypothetical protein